MGRLFEPGDKSRKYGINHLKSKYTIIVIHELPLGDGSKSNRTNASGLHCIDTVLVKAVNLTVKMNLPSYLKIDVHLLFLLHVSSPNFSLCHYC